MAYRISAAIARVPLACYTRPRLWPLARSPAPARATVTGNCDFASIIGDREIPTFQFQRRARPVRRLRSLSRGKVAMFGRMFDRLAKVLAYTPKFSTGRRLSGKDANHFTISRRLRYRARMQVSLRVPSRTRLFATRRDRSRAGSSSFWRRLGDG